MKQYEKSLYLGIAVLLAMILVSCEPVITGCFLGRPSAFKFSVKNETGANISLSLAVGEIPSPYARYGEFTQIPDEVFQIANEIYSNERGAHCTVRPKQNNSVSTELPLDALLIFDELRARLLNKLVSFVFTIKQDEKIIYRIAGWDMPDEDMETYHVDEKRYGYFDLSEKNWPDANWNDSDENWIDSNGNMDYPVVYSALWHDENTHRRLDLSYYLKAVSPDSVVLQEFNPYIPPLSSDNDYWKTR